MPGKTAPGQRNPARVTRCAGRVAVILSRIFPRTRSGPRPVLATFRRRYLSVRLAYRYRRDASHARAKGKIRAPSARPLHGAFAGRLVLLLEPRAPRADQRHPVRHALTPEPSIAAVVSSVTTALLSSLKVEHHPKPTLLAGTPADVLGVVNALGIVSQLMCVSVASETRNPLLGPFR